MANLTIKDFQRQLDDLVIQTERLRNMEQQAQEVVAEFNRVGASAEDLAKANKKLSDAQYKLAEHTAALDAKQQEILDKADAAGYNTAKLNPNRSYEEVMRAQSGGGDNGGGIGSFFSKRGGGNIAAGVMNTISGLINLGSEIYIAEQKKRVSSWLQEQDIYINTIETTSRIFQRNMKTFAKTMQGALSSSFASITQGVQEGAYAAAENSVTAGAEVMSNRLEKEMDILMQQQYAVLRAKKGELERFNLTAQEIAAGASAVSSLTGMIPVVGQAVGGLITSIATASTKIMAASKEIEIMKLEKVQEMAQKQLDIINKIQQEALESASNAVKQVLEFSKSIENLSLKTDAAARSMSNMLGMSGQNVKGYEKYIYNTARNMSFTTSEGKTMYLDKTPEDMAKMQAAYIDASKRNITMNRQDFIKTTLLGKELGDENLAATLLGDMDYFNQTIENSTDLIHDMFIEANKAGVSNRKFAKDLEKNLRLAQKYTFKGGVEGLMKMSIWAQKTRFNMDSLETIVDKIAEGGIEGAITQSAQLQVLGGNMAMYSDPFGMMYDAMADPEALGKRYNKMLEGMGTFNKKTGQAEINIPDRYRLQAYAKATGISYQDAVAQVNQGVKNNQIDNFLKQNGGKQYTEEEKALLYSKAQYNTDTGQWQVTLDNGNRVENISNLTRDDLTQLMPVEERIEDHVAKIMDYTAQMAGVTIHGQAMVADETKENLWKNIDERMKENLRFFNEDIPILKEEVIKSNDFVTEQNAVQHNLIKATNDILDQQFRIIKASAEQMIKDLQDGGSKMRLALNVVEAKLLGGAEDVGKALDALCKELGIEIDRPREEEIKKEKEEQAKQERIKAHEAAAKKEFENKNYGTSYGHAAEAERLKGNSAAASGLDRTSMRMFSGGPLRDGITYNNSTSSSSMLVSAQNVTPINDGGVKFAETDPKDFGLFAKIGGPFDTLVNGVFSEIMNVNKIVTNFNDMLKQNEHLYKINDSVITTRNEKNAVYSYSNTSSTETTDTNSSVSNVNSVTNELTNIARTIESTTNSISETNSLLLKTINATSNSSSKVSSNIVGGNTYTDNTTISTNSKNSQVNNASAYTRQVNGGDIVSNQDYLTMLYDKFNSQTYSYNSPVSQQTNTYTTRNGKTGDIDLNVADRMEMFGYAKENGIPYEEVKNFITNNNSGGVSPREINSNRSSVERYDNYSSEVSSDILQNETLIDRLETILSENKSLGSFNGGSLELKITGSIDLTSGNQSIDITEQIRRDPTFIRSLVELMSYQLSSNKNGGKSEMFPGRYT